jgi:4-amino-4-deoxy-L-arabinose transferase-like glycosyltransferase
MEPSREDSAGETQILVDENSKLNFTFLSLLFLLVIFFIATVPFQTSIPFFTRGEPREALVAQSMIEQSEYILPRVYNNNVPSKPPFLHWCIVFFSKIFGNFNELTARLPSIFTSIFFLAYFFFFARKHARQDHSLPPSLRALLSVLVLSLTIEWLRHAVICRVDMMHSSAMAFALCSWYVAFSGSFQKFPIVCCIGLSIAVLTKGPVGIVLPFCIFAISLLVLPHQGERKFLLLSPRIFGIHIFLFIISLIPYALWFLAAIDRVGDDFLSKFYYENFARFSGTMEDKPHEHGIFYLPLMTLVGTMPWSGMLCLSYGKIIWRKIKGNIFSPKAMLQKPLHFLRNVITQLFRNFHEYKKSSNSFTLYLWICIILFFLFYSIPSGKRSVYVLGIYPFLSYFFVSYVNNPHLPLLNNKQGWSSITSKRIVTVWGIGMVLLLFSQSVLVPYIAKSKTEKNLADRIDTVTKKMVIPYELKVYSIDYGFYGLSYYLKKQILEYKTALPKPIENHIIVLKRGSLLSFIADDSLYNPGLNCTQGMLFSDTSKLKEKYVLLREKKPKNSSNGDTKGVYLIHDEKGEISADILIENLKKTDCKNIVILMRDCS